MVVGEQTSRNRRPLGVIARAALRERERQLGIILPSLDYGEHLGPPPEISPDDERDLIAFFRLEQEGGEVAESNYDSMLERMGVYLRESYPCVTCGGILEVREHFPAVDADGRPVLLNGKQVTEERVVVEEKRGTGYIRDSETFREWKRIEEICRRPTDREAIRAWLARENGMKAECPDCSGGWRFRWLKDPKRPPTVEITGEIPRYSPQAKREDFERVRILGRIGPRRAALRHYDRLAEAALGLYYPARTLSSLWPLTSWGQRQLRRKPQGVPTRTYFRTLQERGVDTSGADVVAQQIRARMFRGWAEVSAR